MTSSDTRKIVAAGAIGNILEWYDFAVYGYFAAEIGGTFFPSQSPASRVVAAFGIFAVGYLMRPVGGAIVGHIGDKVGRRAALTISVTAMAIPTFLVGMLPGYATLGLAAPILLALLRMIQGLSVGGEYTTSLVFVIEHAPPNRRGLIGAMACSGGTIGILLGSATGALLGAILPAGALDAWGWRIPFLFGLAIGVAGLVLRRGTVDATRAANHQPSPIREILHDHKALLARFAGLSVFVGT
jgi:MFS transporter, MHS family, proline/betaine transporter